MIEILQSHSPMLVTSFVAFLLLFVIIGALSLLKNRHTTTDYLVAGRNVKPWLVSLSAVATNNSGYMFTGMIGFTYSYGLSSIWLMIGWITGDLVASLLLLKPIRETSGRYHLHSYGGLISQWWGQEFWQLRRLAGILVVLFLGAYAAAQFTAGSKALHVLMGWDLSAGAIVGATIVLVYSFAGGLRASIWTDAAQSCVMIVAMGLMMFKGLEITGGWSAFQQQLHAVSPTYMNWFPADSSWLSALGFVLGWLFAGFGVAGQPHIMVRYMTLESPDQANRVRIYYYLWFAAFYGATIVVGLLARLLIPESDSFDAELALPTIAQQLLPDVLVGLVIAGIFAATMSTADSLVLSCSASITRDLHEFEKPPGYLVTKLATLGIVLLALTLALIGPSSVFELVVLAWGLLAAAFAPLLIAYRFNRRPSERQAISVVLCGVVAYLVSHYSPLSGVVYEALPAMTAGLLLAFALPMQRQQANVPG